MNLFSFFGTFRAKKCSSLFLACLLLVSNIGLAVNVHYCEGEIAGVSSVYNIEEVCEEPANTFENVCCAEEKEAEHEKCCSDKFVDLQDKTNDVIVKSFSFQIEMPFISEDWKALTFTQTETAVIDQIITYYCDANAPPLFKLFSQYIFYA